MCSCSGHDLCRILRQACGDSPTTLQDGRRVSHSHKRGRRLLLSVNIWCCLLAGSLRVRACIDQSAALCILPASLPEHWVPLTEHGRFPHISCLLHPNSCPAPLDWMVGGFTFSQVTAGASCPCLLYSETSVNAGPVASSLPFRYPLWMDMT